MTSDLIKWLPLGSLVVAALAVFVGPWISARATTRQVKANLLAANKQIVGPMRQAWINSLREKVAEVLSTSWWYYVSGEDPSGPDRDGLAGSRVERRLRFVVQEIELMLNLLESDHVELLSALNATVDACHSNGEPRSSTAVFPDHHRTASDLCRRVLKREWNRVNAELPYENRASVVTKMRKVLRRANSSTD